MRRGHPGTQEFGPGHSELRAADTRAVRNLDQGVVATTCSQFAERLELCAQQKRGRFEHMLWEREGGTSLYVFRFLEDRFRGCSVECVSKYRLQSAFRDRSHQTTICAEPTTIVFCLLRFFYSIFNAGPARTHQITVFQREPIKQMRFMEGRGL